MAWRYRNIVMLLDYNSNSFWLFHEWREAREIMTCSFRVDAMDPTAIGGHWVKVMH